jgi:hypothetical protein
MKAFDTPLMMMQWRLQCSLHSLRKPVALPSAAAESASCTVTRYSSRTLSYSLSALVSATAPSTWLPQLISKMTLRQARAAHVHGAHSGRTSLARALRENPLVDLCEVLRAEERALVSLGKLDEGADVRTHDVDLPVRREQRLCGSFLSPRHSSVKCA